MNKRGFLLYIVVAVLFALAILAFALNSLKQGAVTQLAKNVDQNRLTLLAQSANNEVFAMIRSQVNEASDSSIFQKFREIFPGTDGTSPSLPARILLFNNFIPLKTLELAQSAGYKLKIKCKAVLHVFKSAPYKSVTAFNGYLDVYSQAYRENFESNSIEVHERREVRLVDLRHKLDKYVLFVKNYCPDFNNPQYRLVVQGISPAGPDISKVYVGSYDYPECDDPQKNLWFDLNLKEANTLPGLGKLFDLSGGLTKFDGAGAKQCMLNVSKVQFATLGGVTVDQFTSVPAVMYVYEKFVNTAADGCFGSSQPFKRGSELTTKCKNALPHSNSNAISYRVCDDFAKNANGFDYSKCEIFKQILGTCVEKWEYHFGYTDAESIWSVNTAVKPKIPLPMAWATALAYCGLATTTADFRDKGPYFAEYLDKSGGKPFNPERFRVGKMPLLYGEDKDTPVLVEGPAYLRFFKLAYFNDFSTSISYGNESGGNYTEIEVKVEPEPVPIYFRRNDKSKTFQNTVISPNLSPSSYFQERYLMSRAVDDLSINSLLGETLSYFDGDGNAVTINPLSGPHPTFELPIQPSGSSYEGVKWGRIIDFKTVSRNYSNPEAFLNERVVDDTLFVDGVIYIESGDLDLSKVRRFYGKGMIYLGKGNCSLGNLKRARSPDEYPDSLRLYLRQGDFIIKSSANEIEIQASLAAFYYPFGQKTPQKQGSLIINGKSLVRVYGNLLVDYLYTQANDGSGLAKDGKLEIMHDPMIYDPAYEDGSFKGDPYHISIAPAKSLFSINAGEKTF